METYLYSALGKKPRSFSGLARRVCAYGMVAITSELWYAAVHMTYDQSHLSQVRQKLDQVSPSFCMAKWNQVTIHLQNGHTHSCHHPGTHKVPLAELKQNPSALHNTILKKFMRLQMLRGERPPECQYCWNIEDSSPNAYSDRHFKSASDWSWPDYEKISKADPGANIQPAYVEVSFSNHCNFKCSYCMPHISSKWMEEIKSFGPYPTRYRQNNLESVIEKEQMPIEEGENPYVEAFWRWWPELYPTLRVFRITGGEPLLSPSTFRVLEMIIEKPNPNLVLAINSNLGVPDRQLDRFLALAERITREKMVRGFEIYTSVDSWGKQAEYIRHGLNCDVFAKNAERVLASLPQVRLNFMVTYNALSPFQFTDYLKFAHSLKMKYSNPEATKQVFVDISYLRNPEHQSVRILPLSFISYIEKSLAYMRPLAVFPKGEEYLSGFLPFEIHKLERIVEWMKAPNEPQEIRVNRIDFVKFFREHDKRRGTDLVSCFPELKQFWDDCQKLIAD